MIQSCFTQQCSKLPVPIWPIHGIWQEFISSSFHHAHASWRPSCLFPSVATRIVLKTVRITYRQVMEARPPRSPVLLFLTAKPGNEATAPPRPHPHHTSKSAYMTEKFLSVIFSEFTYAIQPVMDTKQFMNLGDPGINFCIVSVKSWITAQVTMNTQISTVSPKSTSGIGRRPPSYILHI